MIAQSDLAGVHAAFQRLLQVVHLSPWRATWGSGATRPQLPAGLDLASVCLQRMRAGAGLRSMGAGVWASHTSQLRRSLVAGSATNNRRRA